MTDDTFTDAAAATFAPEPGPDAQLELRRKNMRWGWALLGLFILLFGGTVGVAFIYLWLS